MKRVSFLLMACTLVLACSDTATEPALDLPPDLGLEPPSFAPPNRLAATQRTVRLSPMYGDVAKMRWKDIADHSYDPAVQAPAGGYDYAQARVTVTFTPDYAVSFEGHLSARGLKPNFAYQLKLEGKPDIDDWANSQLFRLGREWGALGYLVFDYVVTDSKGKVEHDMDLVSSYHVLWRVDQRVPGLFDSAPTSHPVEAQASSEWYDANYPPETRQIFAQNEHSPYPPGTVVLPAGQYEVSFLLTEESFHFYDDGDWATVMGSDDIRFGIDEPAPEPGDPEPGVPEPVDPKAEADRNTNGFVCKIERVKGNGATSVRYVDDKNDDCSKGVRVPVTI